MARTLSAIIFLALFWYIESQEAANHTVYTLQAATHQRNSPVIYQLKPPTGYQRTPPTAYQRTPPTTYQRTPPTTYQRTPPTTYQRTPPTAYQRTPPTASYQRKPPAVVNVYNPYGYGKYKWEEKCTNPSLSYRVFTTVNSSSTFWQIPKKPRVGSQITVGKKRRRRSVWVMEFINVTSSDPKYVVRTSGSRPLYLTYDSSGEVSLQKQVTQKSYFIFEIGVLGGYRYRVPGSKLTLGVMKKKLHLVNDQIIWHPRQNNCPGRGMVDCLAIKRYNSPAEKWFYDDYDFFHDVFVDVLPGVPPEARWISHVDPTGVGRDFRTAQNTLYLSWITATDPLTLQTAVAAGNNRIFGGVRSDLGSYKFHTTSVNIPKYILLNTVTGPNILGLDQKIFAEDWELTFLGGYCGTVCYPKYLYPSCIWQLTVASSSQNAATVP